MQVIEKKRLYKFLIGLNKNLDEVRGKILGTKPLPTIREAFSKVRREENMMKIMLKVVSPNLETSALTTRGIQQSTKKKMGCPWCDRCHKIGHTSDTYWEIHDKSSRLEICL